MSSWFFPLSIGITIFDWKSTKKCAFLILSYIPIARFYPEANNTFWRYQWDYLHTKGIDPIAPALIFQIYFAGKRWLNWLVGIQYNSGSSNIEKIIKSSLCNRVLLGTKCLNSSIRIWKDYSSFQSDLIGNRSLSAKLHYNIDIPVTLGI